MAPKRKEEASGTSLLREFVRECACVRRSVQGDLEKSIQDGKSIILEVSEAQELLIFD